MKNNYGYPIDYSLYSTDEIIQIVKFFEQIEKYYHKQTTDDKILLSYDIFRNLVTSKAERNAMYKQFLKDSGYDTYAAIDILTKNSKK